MKIEYLDGKNPHLPLIRLFDFSAGEITELRKTCNDLADGRSREFPLQAQPWVRAIGECQFIWRTSTKDVGVLNPATGQPFVLDFSAEAWREVGGKLAEFVDPHPNSFNWLTNEGSIGVLISMNGSW